MLNETTLRFAKDLGKNNAKAWVDAHRAAYHAARDDILTLGKELIDRADDYDAQISRAGIKARHLTRYNRDPRFRRGKPPYRTDVDLFLNSGSGAERVGYYLHVEPGNCYAGASLFIPSRTALARMRNLLATRTTDWNSIIGAKTFVEIFPDGIEAYGTLKTGPRGYPADHPAIEFLKMTGLGTRAKLTEREVYADDLVNRLVTVFRALEPMATFLNTGA